MILMIVSGRSGSGKSIALRALEDMGFYCVDNIPLALLPQLADSLKNNNTPVAVSIDIRNLPANFDFNHDVLQRLPASVTPEIIFFDCSRNTLIRRYSETRRIHPLTNQKYSLEEAIDLEEKFLEPLKSHASLVINTDNLSVHELSSILRSRILGKKERELTIIFESFGFKHGLPVDADFVFDVRFLPNPHWDINLRALTGLDEPVKQYLLKHDEVTNFIYQTANYLKQWLPLLEKNNRSYLTIAIGCTGGQHRSVFIAEQLAAFFRAQNKQIQVRHRTLEKK
ncbi:MULTISPECIES: RNase adapter RapZ [unclassified Gilliamella]|uniref:RNase adapter RapZ n=1 Tax=unclassified Gilliamella TaxID=2685620 RepID=UPI001C6A7F37|nr:MULTISPECIES: RNase adapter RapZ [unclassified Gilliamella]MCX8602024.1 RNase adapter RapZ [Gilliamella sp. B3722]MCX8608357.1 RNase adapter RapZ [Gilliamella sp. B3771]MCX8611294.1 RNase adapter RapZ [Gilliamella sp. B3891]MCX8613866.1 RNase adapter RapZ [Gilliamella sp. B3773]MCX8616344.1 RNase adapter RapZ [Gilliamella sp. B3770]